AYYKADIEANFNSRRYTSSDEGLTYQVDLLLPTARFVDMGPVGIDLKLFGWQLIKAVTIKS
ncbi:MAG: hypothetical protein IIC76_12000, partial [Bacteroidetes bacterium]|nr:hypothetical protein [Bacteroidota bacterium]